MSITGCVYSPSAQYIVTASNDCTGTYQYMYLLTYSDICVLWIVCDRQCLSNCLVCRLSVLFGNGHP